MTQSQRRTEVMLPADLVEEFAAVAARRGHVRATLLHGWIIDAARIANQGGATGVALPPARGGSAGTYRGGRKLFWKQSAEESEACVQAIQGAGSSVRAVIAEAVRAYVDADGDLLRMSWPFLRAELVAAV